MITITRENVIVALKNAAEQFIEAQKRCLVCNDLDVPDCTKCPEERTLFMASIYDILTAAEFSEDERENLCELFFNFINNDTRNSDEFSITEFLYWC